MNSVRLYIVIQCLLQGAWGFFDPCQVLGICLVNNQGSNRRFSNNFNFAPVNFMKIDDKWITPSDHSSEFAYYFPQNIYRGYDWFEAKKFCEANGGYLAEPKRGGDANFLRSYARSLGNNQNWWIGLREKEQCNCMSSNLMIDNLLNPSELVNTGLLHVSCPQHATKVCNGFASRWVWTFSGTQLYGKGNWGPSEPHHGEYCAILWHKRDFQWSDFGCNSRTDSNNARYKPLCQKSMAPPPTTTTTMTTTTTTTTSTADFDEEDDYDERIDTTDVEENDENHFSRGDVLPNSYYCSDMNVIYRGRNIERPIKDVFSSRRCAELCHAVEECRFWVWRGDKFPQKCILKGNLRRRKFRIQKDKAVSGKKEGCLSAAPLTNTPCSVSHDVKVDNVEVIRNFFGVKTPTECREKCYDMKSLCTTWSWVRLHRKGANTRRGTKCVLSAVSSEAQSYFAYKKGAVTGIYPKESCYEEMEMKQNCSCKSLIDEEENYDDYGDYEFAGTGRISNSGENQENGIQEESLGPCERKVEFQHCPLQEKEKAEERIPISGTLVELSKDEEACIEYGVNFNGGATYQMLEGIPSAEQCRIKCTGICKYWTWKSQSSSCLLKSSNTYFPEANPSSVSGSSTGPCSSATFSSLTRCGCLPVDPEYDYSAIENEAEEYDYLASLEEGETDSSFLDLITVKASDEDCRDGLVKKCGVREASPKPLGGTSRINFS